VDNTRHHVFSRNPKNIIQSDDDDDDTEVTEATKKKANLVKPTTLSQKKKTNHKPIPKPIPKPNMTESDDDDDDGADDDDEDDDEVVVVEQPAESAEAELSK